MIEPDWQFKYLELYMMIGEFLEKHGQAPFTTDVAEIRACLDNIVLDVAMESWGDDV